MPLKHVLRKERLARMLVTRESMHFMAHCHNIYTRKITSILTDTQILLYIAAWYGRWWSISLRRDRNMRARANTTELDAVVMQFKHSEHDETERLRL